MSAFWLGIVHVPKSLAGRLPPAVFEAVAGNVVLVGSTGLRCS